MPSGLHLTDPAFTDEFPQEGVCLNAERVRFFPMPEVVEAPSLLGEKLGALEALVLRVDPEDGHALTTAARSQRERSKPQAETSPEGGAQTDGAASR